MRGEADDDFGEQVAELKSEERPGQIAEKRGAEADPGEIVELGLNQEGEGQPLIVELEHDGGGGERGVEEYSGFPAAGASACEGAGEVQGGGSGGQLPDLIRSGVRPFARGKGKEAESVERQQPRVGAQQVEGFEEEPVEQEEALCLPQRRPGVAVQAAGEIGGDESEEGEAIPRVAMRDVEQRGGQRDEHEHAEGGDLGDGQRDEREEVGEAGDGLGAIFERVDDHARGDGEQQEGGGERVVEDFGGGDGVHGIDGGVERRPSAAEQAVGEGAVLFAALKDDAGDQQGEAGGEAESDASGGADLIPGVIEQQGEADDGDEDAELVDPVAADEGFPIFTGAMRAGSGWCRLDGRRDDGCGALYDGRREEAWGAVAQAPHAAQAAR